MDLSTSYLGLKLNSPLIVGASPFADEIDMACRLQDAGAAAIVMRSLFEEQIYLDELARAPGAPKGNARVPEDGDCFPLQSEYQLSPKTYLRQIGSLKSVLAVPVIASLNGHHSGGWVDYARRFEEAGADAIELNLYHIATDPAVSAQEIEREMLETVRTVKESVRVPIAVKLQPFHSSLANFARELEGAGADGIVLFNRFYQSEFIVGEEKAEQNPRLSDQSELLLRLRWAAILFPHARISIAVSGGVHGGEDVIKAILAGASGVQMVSALLRYGPRFLSTLTDGLRKWMNENHYRDLGEFRGSMSLEHCPDAAAFERGTYQRNLQKRWA
ncbi:MAG TPA: dihydroorotate dehydrogenase-like protein [Opitutaceae bacterium]|nr:dihydroorotate dehydrogenase-like protein [Opitutaceae bacterium]